ncbi:hypothetical protein ATI61_119139 [Archangium gephyra]|uniref:Uncharacterized protein n=1 Tax=Archangium gephyra TaxID=48 RepID=A0AAC8Q9J0_9BACT|nr:hypothetical protein [Archangium gephyra]AKJ03610.1 Hypothetical protein AA314_05236 [Archangium gephyra]REG22609.1 hypothetical protein ATI61_119139 [Archangium gephyra]
MAIAPLSRSSIACPSSPVRAPSAPSTQPVSAPPARESLRQLFAADGFDSPMSAKKAGGLEAGGLEAMVQELARMAQVLSKAAELLGGEGGASGQAMPGLKSLAKGVDGASGAGASAQALPELKSPPKSVDGAGGVGAPGAAKGGNTMTFTNDGTSPMTINFTPNAGDKAIDSLTLEPGKAQTVEFPKGWSGNFRSTSGDGAAATLGEVKFNGGGDQTYYDVSYIEGDNASMTIEPEGGGRKSGTMENLLASAPDSVKAKSADGSVYGIKKTTTSNVQDPGVVDFYRKHVGADQGYVIPTDDASTLATKNSHLVVRMKDLTQGTTGRV